MEQNPYRAPAGSGEPKAHGQRLPVRVWLLVAFLVGWAIIFGILSAVCLSNSVSDLTWYGAEDGPSLGSIVTDAALAIAQFGLSAYAIWCARQLIREARQPVESPPD